MRSGDALNSPRPTSLNKSPGKSPYQLDTCFDRRALQLPHGRRKAQLFAALIPAGCRSVLDAGGGTGWATIGLRQKCHVVTLDGAAESLRQATGDKVLGSVEALPFADRSFDLVISSQVLEHLPDRALDKTRREMMRVARHYLLVSVPYRESLEAREVRCGVCRTVLPRLPLPLICGRRSGETVSALANGGVARVRSAPPRGGSCRFARMAAGAGHSTGLCGHALSSMRESSSRKSFFSAASFFATRQAAYCPSDPYRPQGASAALSRPAGRQAIRDLLAAGGGAVLDCGFVRSRRELRADRWGRRFH
jgi:hypothetical protein